MKKRIALVVFILLIGISVFARTPLAEFDKIKQLKLLESTREDVEKIFADADEDSNGNYYTTEKLNFHFSYAGGNCAEDEDEEWNIPKDKLTEISVILRDSEIAKDLKIDLSKLERIKKYEEDEADNDEEQDPDDFVYYDKEKGISYGLLDGEIDNIKFLPPEKNYPSLCSNENLRQFTSTQEWFLKKIKNRPYVEAPRSVASVNDLTLSVEEIIADCPVTTKTKRNNCVNTNKKISVETMTENPELNVLTYNYAVSGGKIIGNGAKVVWDLTGVKPGDYTITAGVDDGCGVCGKTMTKTVVVKECPDCAQDKK